MTSGAYIRGGGGGDGECEVPGVLLQPAPLPLTTAARELLWRVDIPMWPAWSSSSSLPQCKSTSELLLLLLLLVESESGAAPDMRTVTCPGDALQKCMAAIPLRGQSTTVIITTPNIMIIRMLTTTSAVTHLDSVQ
jgi:hypothetical protein